MKMDEVSHMFSQTERTAVQSINSLAVIYQTPLMSDTVTTIGYHLIS
jgi:hypothetical protein